MNGGRGDNECGKGDRWAGSKETSDSNNGEEYCDREVAREYCLEGGLEGMSGEGDTRSQSSLVELFGGWLS